MANSLPATLDHALGLSATGGDLTCGQMALRALVIFFAALLMLRLGHKRTFAQRNTLDVLLSLVIASMLSRAINGSAPFFPTLTTGFGLIFVHRALAWATARSHWVGKLVKGTPQRLIDDGRVNEATLLRHSISRHDLEEDLRLAGADGPGQVRKADLERSGQISVIRA